MSRLNPRSPVILHIPHSSMYIPDDLRSSFCLGDAELEEEKLKMVDRYTDELFDSDLHQRIIFPVCRLVVDPERFADDSMETMAKKGLGAVYTRTEEGNPLRTNLTEDDKEELIRRFYNPHHEKLLELTESVLNVYGKCLIIDCHSFPSSPLSFEDNKRERPDICIGTDDFHTPKKLSDLTVHLFEDAGFSAALNTPYAGSIVPIKYYHSNNNVDSIMIEMNRRLYMDEKTGEKNPDFDSLQIKIREVIHHLY
ncbi:MAG: N-formylglutamate amidohydrolase [Fusobacteriaceae bacterium]|nr:N-formylglutamate amidohydrolase [Fusobacteriaceae bacterium]